MPIPKSDGYIVPPDPSPTEFQTYLMCIPTDPNWIATVNAALYLLTDPENWDETTEDGQEADIDAAVATARKIVLNFVFQTIEECMTICDLVADCIETDLGVQQAIANAILSSSVIQSAIKQYSSDAGSGQGNVSQPLSPSIMAGNIVPLNALCTDENKYAMARAIVQQLDSLATDFLEVIALITEKKKIAAELVENVPIFGGIASAALDVAAWIDTWVKASYAAAYNSTTEVDYSCVIYCTFDGCDLSWDDVIAAYEEQASVSIPQTDDFLTFVNWLVTDLAPSTDNLIVGAMHLFILNALKWGSSFMGSGVWTALEIAIEDAADEEITVPAECACAPVFNSAEWDFTITDGGFIQQEGGSRGVWVNGSGWESELDGSNGVIIYRAVPANFQLEELSFDYEFDGGTWSISAFLRDNQNSSSGQVTIFNSSGITQSPNCGFGQIVANNRNYLVLNLNDGTNGTITGKITKCRFQYTGDTPSLVTNTGIVVACP